jgi:hypothetical protein
MKTAYNIGKFKLCALKKIRYNPTRNRFENRHKSYTQNVVFNFENAFHGQNRQTFEKKYSRAKFDFWFDGLDLQIIKLQKRTVNKNAFSFAITT